MARSTTIPNGHIITAKGKLLNLSELIKKAKQPIKTDVSMDLKDKVSPQKRPGEQSSVQGFTPDTSNVSAPPVVQIPITQKQAKITRETSLSEITGITIDKSKFLKNRPQHPMGAVQDALAEISTDLANMGKNKK